MENQDRAYYVYEHRCKINNKVYVGISKQNPPNRRWANGIGYKQSEYFWRAICQYGWENFEHTILKDELTYEEASDAEIYYISLNSSADRNFGYNISYGGLAYCDHSPETRKKMSKSIREYWSSPKGEDTKKRIGAKKGNAVYNIEMGLEFHSSNRAGIETGINAGTINSCCKGVGITAGGYHWIYVKDISDEKIKDILSRKINKYERPILCKELNIVFESAVKATKYLLEELGITIHHHGISDACAGRRRKTAAGFHWEFVKGR